jgi:hypothetical protein
MTTNPQVPLPKTAADVSGPAAGTAMSQEYVQTISRMAYIWGWPLVNMANRNAAFSLRYGGTIASYERDRFRSTNGAGPSREIDNARDTPHSSHEGHEGLGAMADEPS